MIRSIKEHLASMYRRDIRDGILRLIVNEEELSYAGYKDEVWMKRIDGTAYKSEFHFTINGKVIKGWVGVLGEGFGGRGKGGFAILQNNRCILSEETMWKHPDIYGREGSTVPQRLVGEIEADGFEVNTQKDDIDWHGTEEEDLAKIDNEKILYNLGYARGVLYGAKWQQKKEKKRYSEKEVFKIMNDFFFDWCYNYKGELNTKEYLEVWFKNFKKVQLPGKQSLKLVYLGRFSMQKNILSLLKAHIPQNMDLIFVGEKDTADPYIFNMINEK
jgi:hypothetical protein